MTAIPGDGQAVEGGAQPTVDAVTQLADAGFFSLQRLRRGFVFFIAGKTVNGLFGFLVLVLVARGLTPVEFGTYVILVSVAQSAISIFNFGVSSVAQRYLPQFRLGAGSDGLMRFVLALLGLRVLSLSVCLVVLYLGLGVLVRVFGIEAWRSSAAIYLSIVIFAGMFWYWQTVFEPLLLQGNVQLNWLARNFGFCGLVAAALWQGRGTLHLSDVIYAEVLATAVATFVGFLQLWLYWRGHRSHAASPGWRRPSTRSLVRFAFLDFVGFMLELSGNQQAIMLLAGHMFGPAELAGFGFAMTFVEQIRKYLPAELFWAVIQPKLIAAYSQTGDVAEVVRRGLLMYKAGLFMLGPAIVLFLVYGRGTLDLLSHLKYGQMAPVAVVLLVTLVPLSHQRPLRGIVMILERPALAARGALAWALTIPLCLAALLAGWGSLGLAGAAMTTALLYNGALILGLRRAGFGYRVDFVGIGKIALATLGAAACLTPSVDQVPSIPRLLLVSASSVGLFLLIAFFLKPFTGYERNLINRLMNRRLAFW
jgi:O-antigen/teichoic acid export membrane protein